MSKTISVIIPVYNESGNIKALSERLYSVFEKIEEDFEFIFINDGSVDDSLKHLQEIAKKDRRIKIIDFARNFGHQIAVTAGIDNCGGDCAIIIDADLQDPPELIPQLLEKWKDDYQVVYAHRIQRKGESFFKLFTASLFYRILRKLTHFEIPLDTGDFRLIDKKIIEVLRSMPEKNRFIRGMVSWSGFRQTGVDYIRDERYSGETKYSLTKMAKFAITGTTSFSFVPLQIATYFGFLTSFLALLSAVYFIFLKVFTDATVQGWTSLIVVILFLGGVQLITLGIIGEYVGRISDEIKQRPTYIVNKKINF